VFNNVFVCLYVYCVCRCTCLSGYVIVLVMCVCICVFVRSSKFIFGHPGMVWCLVFFVLLDVYQYRLLNITLILFVCVYCVFYGIYESKAHSKNKSQHLQSDSKMCKRILTR